MTVIIYGVYAVAFMMVMYALESHGPRFILGFALGCVLSSVYGSCRALGRSAWSS